MSWHSSRNCGREAGPRLLSIQAKQLTITGSRLRPRSATEKAGITASLRKVVWPLIETGAIKPIIDSKCPLREAPNAHERVQASQHVGKILLVM